MPTFLQTVVIAVQDLLAVPIPHALVTLRKGRLYASGTTDSAGNYTLVGTDPGTYALSVEHPDYVTDNQSLVVTDPGSSTVETTTVSLTPFLITNPVPPGTCRVYGFVVIQTAERVLVFVEEQTTPPALLTTGGSGVNPENQFVAANERTVMVRDGLWTVDLTIGIIYRVRIPELQFEKRFLVPNATTAAITDVHSYPHPTDPGQVGA